MKRLSIAVLLALAACSDSDTDEPEPSAEPTSTGMYVVRVDDVGQGTQLLTASEPELEGATKPELISWRLDEGTQITLGDTVTIVGETGECAESYPPQCRARTAQVEREAGEAVAIFGPYEQQQAPAQEIEMAVHIGAAIINTGDPLSPDELGGNDDFFGDMLIIETDPAEVADHADLPTTDIPIILIAPADEIDDLGDVLFDQGFQAVIALADR